MKSSNGNIFRVTGPPVTGGFPSQKPEMHSFDVFFDLCLTKGEQTIETPEIWDAIVLIMTSLWWTRMAQNTTKPCVYFMDVDPADDTLLMKNWLWIEFLTDSMLWADKSVSGSTKLADGQRRQIIHFPVHTVYFFDSSPPSAAYMCQWIGSALVQIMACRLFGVKPLSKPMGRYCQLDP